MIKVMKEINIEDFEAWSGGEDTLNRIIEEGKTKEFEDYINDLYSDGIDETQLNDILWFDSQQVLQDLGINEYDTDEIVEDFKKDYLDELKEGYKEDETVDYVIDDIIEKSTYHDSITDEQRDEIVEQLDDYLSSL